MAATAEANAAVETQTSTGEPSLLESLLDDAHVERDDAEAYGIAKRGIEAFLGELLTSRNKYEKIDRGAVDLMIAEIDKRLETQVNEYLHHPDVQKLESTWRSVKYLVDQTDFRENIKIELMPATKQDLMDDFDDSPDIVKSGLYRQIYSAEYGTFGGQPFGLILTDFDFASGHEDIRLLQQLASVASMAHAPLLANASPKLFGEDDYLSLPSMRDLKAHFDSPQFARWRSFRENEDSRYIGLCMPRFMLRQPYAPGQNSVRAFEFEEDVIDEHDHYLWGPASFALAARCADSFANYRWCANIIGPRAGGAVEDLPLHQYEAMGELQTKLPVEVQLTERREYELSEEGFIGLTHRKGSDNAAFFSANSVQRPKVFGKNDKDSELNYRLGTQLPYMFIVSRVAHYLKVMQRENLGTYKTKDRLQFELSWWLANYTTSTVANDTEMAKYPFKESEVIVEDVPGNAGWFRCKIQLVPHFKYMGADFTLSLVGKLDKSLNATD